MRQPTCPICDLPKVHHRLRGYVCSQEQHNEWEREINDRITDAKIEGLISDDEWESWLLEDKRTPLIDKIYDGYR